MRFIPAGAGNTLTKNQSGIVASVYPRWRGEHSSKAVLLIGGDGLSPLARGTRPDCGPSCFNYRFIPAGAGNTTRFTATT